MTLLLCPSCEKVAGDDPLVEIDAELTHRVGRPVAYDDVPCLECWNVDE